MNTDKMREQVDWEGLKAELKRAEDGRMITIGPYALAAVLAEHEKDKAEIDGWRGTVAELDKTISAQRAEIEALLGLLARCGNHIRQWHEKYGEYQPAWLPPANGALFIEAIDAAIATK